MGQFERGWYGLAACIAGVGFALWGGGPVMSWLAGFFAGLGGVLLGIDGRMDNRDVPRAWIVLACVVGVFIALVSAEFGIFPR